MSNLLKEANFPDGWVAKKRKKGEEDLPIELVPQSLHIGLWVKALKTLGQKLRFNLITLEPELNGIPFQPNELDTLYCLLGEHGYSISKLQAIDGVVFASMKNSYNPVQEELINIENNENITPVDIDKLATEYLGTNDPLYDAMLAACCIGAIARAFDYGCKMQYVLCLKGKQGLKKSEFWRILAGEYFCETEQGNLKDLKLAMNCCWIYEYPEIEQLTTRKDVGQIKSLITAQKDRFRLPYGSSIGTYPRKSILVGSLNEDEFLRDKTGSRRFWVIDLPFDPDIGEKLDTDKLTRDRERILKAAIIAHRNGRLPMMTLEQQNESNRRNLDYESQHPYQDAIEKELRKWGGETEFSIQGLLSDAGIKTEIKEINQKDMYDVAKILKTLGYKKTRQSKCPITNSRARLWKKCLQK